jgi:hypothetical protein
MGEMIYSYKFLPGKVNGRDHMEDLGVEGWIILEWVLKT